MARSKMRDGIVKRGSTWSFKVELDRDPETGERRQKWVGGYRTREEAKAARDEQRTRLRHGTYVEPSKLTVAEYLKDWLPSAKARLRPGSYDAVEIHVRVYIEPRIGSVQLQKLTRTRVKALYAELKESGRVRKSKEGVARPLSSKTVHNIHRTLCKALNEAVADGLLSRNPAARAHQQPESPVQSTWTAAQLRRFFASIAEDRLFALWLLAPSTGLRRGELAGLRWSDVDLGRSCLALIEQRAKGHGTVAASRLKGKRGRPVALDAKTVGALRAHRKRQLRERMEWPGQWENTADLVFTHANGKPLHPDTITNTLKQRVKDAGLPWIKLHGLRHTHATLALKAGVHTKVVQERLGHSSMAITADVYSHVTPGLQEDAAARVAALVDEATDESEDEDVESRG